VSTGRRTGCIRFESAFGAGGQDEPRFDRPLFVLDGKGNVLEENMSEFLAWRKRTAPEAYKSAMDGLIGLLAEIAVRELILETEIDQPGFSFFWACRERMRTPRG
jgi:hypothetical protein